MVVETGVAKHVGKALRQGEQIDADRVMVQFSPEVLRGFARLEAAVHKSEHFSPDILVNLQEYTAGKPLSVQSALTGIAFFTKEAMEHVNATGDKRAKEALDDLIGNLLGLNKKPPFTLTEARVKGR